MMRRFLILLLVAALLPAGTSCRADISLSGIWTGVQNAASAVGGWFENSAPFRESVTELFNEALRAGSETAAQIGKKLFADRPIPQIMEEMGFDSEAGNRFSAFLSGFFEEDIRTGAELKSALTRWLEKQGLLIGRLAEDALFPVLGAGAFCLYMLFGGGVLALIGEITPEEYAFLRTTLAEGMRSLLADISDDVNNAIYP